MRQLNFHIFHSGSIRLRLVAVYSGVVFITLVIVGLAIYRSVVTNLDSLVDGNLQERADAARRYFATHTEFTPQDLDNFERAFAGASVSRPSVSTKPGVPRPTPAPIQADFSPDSNDLSASLIYLQVTFLNGQIWRVPSLEAMLQTPTQNELRTLLVNTPTYSNFDTTRLNGKERVRVYTIALTVRGQMVGHVQAVRSLEELDAIVNSLTLPFVTGTLAAIVLMALGGWLVVGRAFGPIERITEAAYRIGVNDDLTERIDTNIRTTDEVSRLSQAFNSMLDRVEKNFKSQKQFIADSSHELRTPLTVIRGNVDLLKRNPDPQNQAESLRAIEREAERMQRLVEDLLLLAQADAKQSVEMLPLQLDTLVLDIYMNTRVLADASRQTLKLGHFDPVTVQGDADRLKRALLNLVDNAIKYTPEEGTITVSLYKGKKWARIVVADNGAGIAEKDQTLIFDRFYRVDKARSRGSGSTGLGLAIVKHIVEAHGGRITLESEVGKGSTFTIWLQHAPTDATDFSDDDDTDATEFVSDSDGSQIELSDQAIEAETPAAPVPTKE